MMGIFEKLDICVRDRDECVGDKACCDLAGSTFFLDDGMTVIVKDNDEDSVDDVVDAARSCPLELITVVNKETGEQLYPDE